MPIELTRPELLYLLGLIPFWALLTWPRAGRGVLYARGEPTGQRLRWSGVRAAAILLAPRVLRVLAFASLVMALTGPQRIEIVEEMTTEGKGIGLVVDLSSSMLAEDMGEAVSRIEVAREAAIRFARRRPYDEMSLVGFGGQALTRVPPTNDPELIAQGVESLEIQLVRDGTDISGAVLTAISRLLESEREPRVVVLLTDGAHNGVELPPLVTARAAAALDVRIHAISILSPDESLLGARPTIGRLRLAQDRETVLQGLAGLTGGEYFRASSAAALDSIYSEIDRIETPVERLIEREVRHSERRWFFVLALTLLGIELLLRGSRWGLVP